MNKNLKKVISAVAALAMSASSFVALAADFPDVDSSASYKQAIDELTALNVINGYEDGTFQPDKLVTRAEFAKMIITALGSSELAQAEAASGRDTQFTDVTGSHWAAGYVTAASSNAIVNGMGDGTFAPDSNITYAQAMKMLVCAAGYEQWSVDKGGWPDGYMYYGNQLKIGNGVKDVTDSTEITRAQVAQMIDNVLTAPVCVDTKEYTYDAYGNKYPKLVAKDGYGEDYESILSKNHDAYKVKGTVTGNYKSGDTSKTDEVKFTIQNARKWLDEEEQISKSKNNAIDETFKVGDTDLADYLQQYVEVLVQENDDDEYVALSVVLAGQNDEVTLAADDFDYDNSNYSGTNYIGAGKLYFYNNGKTSSYKVDSSTLLYVNGVKVTDVNTGIDTYVKNNKSSDVTLIDSPSSDSNSTDGIYDLILVNYYATAVVDDITDADDTEPTIGFKADDFEQGSWDLDLDDDTVTYTFTKDGQEISVADLAEYDVLSIKYDVTNKFNSSNFYDVTVSSATEEGKYSLYNKEDAQYTVNGTVYDYNEDILGTGALDTGVVYTLYIDAFGTIAYYDELSSAKKIAILDNVYSDASGDWKAKVVYSDGTTDTLALKDSGTNIDDAKAAYGGSAGTTSKEVYERVIEYTINSSNELTVKKNLDPDQVNKTSGVITTGEYKESSNKIGSVKFNDATSFISYTSSDEEYASMDPSTLVDGDYYTAFGYSKNSDSISRFVIVLDAAGSITSSTRVAVFNKSLSTENDNGDSVTAYDLFVDGENVVINGEDSTDLAEDLVQGAAVQYSTNASGEITGFRVLTNDVDFTNTTTVWDAFLTDSQSVIATAKAELQKDTGKYDADLYFGAIVNKTAKSIELSDITDYASNEDGDYDISYDSDVRVYVVDYNKKSDERISVGSVSSIVKATYANSDVTNGVISWAKYDDDDNVTSVKYPRVALVKTEDKDATDIVVYIPKK
jgi:hypothetical protein